MGCLLSPSPAHTPSLQLCAELLSLLLSVADFVTASACEEERVLSETVKTQTTAGEIRRMAYSSAASASASAASDAGTALVPPSAAGVAGSRLALLDSLTLAALPALALAVAEAMTEQVRGRERGGR